MALDLESENLASEQIRLLFDHTSIFVTVVGQ